MQVSSHSVPSKSISPSVAPLVVQRCRRAMGWLTHWLMSLPQTVLIGSLQAYKLLISPLLGSRCRFHPSCSSYAQISIQRFGVLKGGWLSVRRLARCGPWHPGGIDEVPCQTHTHSSESS